MEILAFGHRRRVGKDTSCNFLMTMLKIKGYKVEKISFAYKLKRTCHTLFAWAGVKTPEYYEENQEKKEDFLPDLRMTVRELWIKFGNDMRLYYHYDTWIRAALQNIKTDIILISDLRYKNEAEYILNLGGKIIKIDRPDIPKSDDIADSALADWSDWDEIITNDGTLSDLNATMLHLAEREKWI